MMLRHYLLLRPTELCFKRLASLLKKDNEYNYDALKIIEKQNNALKLTHTAAVYPEHDVRNLRFLMNIKLVDDKFAIEEIAKVDVKYVNSNKVWCNGGDDHLGHPKVFINLDKPGPHICGYCGLRFEKSYK